MPPQDVTSGVAQAHSGLVSIPGLGTAKVATMGQRLLARLVDGAILFVVYLALAAIFGGAAAATVTVDPVTGQVSAEQAGAFFGAAILVWFLLFVVVLAYEIVMIALWGATLGKKVLGLKVVLSANGQVPGFGPSFIRWVIPVVGALACGVGQLVVYLSPLFDNSGRVQGWHDKAANTLVVATK